MLAGRVDGIYIRLQRYRRPTGFGLWSKQPPAVFAVLEAGAWSLLGISRSDSEKIQKRDRPSGPSPRNSWPRPCLHLPQYTLRALGRPISGRLYTLSSWTVSVKDGHGEWWANLDRLENSS